MLLIRAYQNLGHELADLDPLKLEAKNKQHGMKLIDHTRELDYKYYGFTDEALE